MRDVFVITAWNHIDSFSLFWHPWESKRASHHVNDRLNADPHVSRTAVRDIWKLALLIFKVISICA